MITLNNINLSSIDLSGIDLRGIKLGLEGRGGGSGDGFPQLPGDVTRWHFGGLTNEMMAAMDDPRIEDADHKGRFLSFKNFLWAGMSGVGGYETNAEIYEFSPTSTNKIVADRVKHISYTFEVKGMVSGNDLSLRDGINTIYYSWKKDGIYTVDVDVLDPAGTLRLYNGYSHQKGTFTVRIFPSYPGAIVFDGVDDCGVCDNFPILTKEKGYTVVALRSIIDKNIPGYLLSNSAGSNQGAFIFERTIDSLTASFGKSSPITVNYNNPLTYQTTSKYNQKSISVGELLEGGKSLVVGRNSKEGNLYANAAIWELVFLDHDATEEELTKIKDYFVKTYPWLFPDQAWTVTGKTNEDEDRATISNITGNGNDLVLSNFAFSGNSGYGLYVCNFNDTSTWTYYSYNGTIEITSSTIHVTEAKTARPFFEKNSSSGGYNKVKIKVTGIKDGEILKFMSDKDIDNTINIEKDGIYSLPGSDKLYYGFRLSNSTNTYPFNCDITIEQIPEYEGYLVADGVDDTIVSKERFTIQQYFTIVGDWQFIIKEDKNSGVIINGKLYCYNRAKGILVYVNNSSYYNDLADTIKIKALSSDGKVYDENWDDIQVKTGDVVNTNELIQIAGHSQQSKYTRVAFKNIAIYNSLLSKDDCIKAYNYLQTLKSK
jgi:hypothetical protein